MTSCRTDPGGSDWLGPPRCPLPLYLLCTSSPRAGEGSQVCPTRQAVAPTFSRSGFFFSRQSQEALSSLLAVVRSEARHSGQLSRPAL